VPVLFGPKNAGLVSEWSDEDYDVLEDSVVVGRIFKANAAPVGTPWMWAFIMPHLPCTATASSSSCSEEPLWC
jgi:hypothetical protein